MSQWRGQLDSEEYGPAVGWLAKWYHVPTVALLIVFMFWTRVRTWGKFFVDGDILFSGNDPWYHLREVTYITKNYPSTMPYDVWTKFPEGTSVSQFGTLFDQVIATVAMIVGLGDPSQRTVALALLFVPPALGALIAIPTYYIGSRLGGRFSGVVAVLVLALSSGQLLNRSLVGFADHHVAEALTQALAVAAIVIALQVADREKPVWELVLDRDVAALRRPVGYAALAGVAIATYVAVWPPGVLLIGILGLYFTVQLVVNYLRDESPEHIAISGAVMFAVAALLLISPIDRLDISTVKFSLLQPGLALAGAVWCGFLAWLSREWDTREYPAWTYPLPAVGIVFGGLGVLAIALPGVFDFLINNISRVLVPGSTSGAASTVGEVQPLPFDQAASTLRGWYGFAPFLAGAGVLVALGRQAFADESRSELVFVSLLLIIIMLATLTQQRFAYYLTVPMAVMTAYLVGEVFSTMRSWSDSSDIETFQILLVMTVLVIVIVPTVLGGTTALSVSSNETNGPGGGIQGWHSSLEWMSNNTPAQGNFAGAGNAYGLYDTFPKQDDFQYKNGSYGVLSWWDYGHWITVDGNRTPVANPFQDNAKAAARFLLAQNESRADEVLANLSDGKNRDVRYVMVDWKMATGGGSPGKFFAPPAFVDGVSVSDYYHRIYPAQEGAGGGIDVARPFALYKQPYYESMAARLYRFHGSAQRAVPTVTRWGTLQSETESGGSQTIKSTLLQGNKTFFSSYARRGGIQRARQVANNSTTAQVGGLGPFPGERVSALNHYRLVQASERSAGGLTSIHPNLARAVRNGFSLPGIPNQILGQFGDRNPRWVKIFERVPGATINGTGPANASVTASVSMNIPNGRNFTYRAVAQTGADGEFNMTVPYSTTGADNWGPEQGYTNTSVRAEGPYTFSTRTASISNGSFTQTTYNATANVSEAQVIGEDPSPVSVTLTRASSSSQNITTGGGSSSSGDTSGDSSSGDTSGSSSSNALPEPDVARAAD